MSLTDSVSLRRVHGSRAVLKKPKLPLFIKRSLQVRCADMSTERTSVSTVENLSASSNAFERFGAAVGSETRR